MDESLNFKSNQVGSATIQPTRKKSKYPFETMKVGECFDAVGIKKTTMSTYICAYIKRHTALAGRKFKITDTTSGLVANVTVTRVK